MQMFPWEKQKLKCETSGGNIKNYNVPRNINLEIYGWGRGKFTNEQYFGTRSFNLNTNGWKYSKFSEKIFGENYYDFDIPVKNNKWGDTHSFSIPKKKVTYKENGKKVIIEWRTLLLMDMQSDENEDPVAFWRCIDEK